MRTKAKRSEANQLAFDRLQALNLSVEEVYLVEPEYVCFETTDHKARTARFKQGKNGPVLEGVSFGWPVL